MKYKITKQFAKDKETLLAEFNELDDANLFIEVRNAVDETNNAKLIYRLFDGGKLLKEYNKDKMSSPIGRAQYAQGDMDLPDVFAGPFNISNQDNPLLLLAKCSTIDDARLFIKAKLNADLAKKIHAIYTLFNGKQLVEKINQDTLEQEQSQGSEGKQQQATFRPTPFALAPKLGPSNWLKDADEDKDEGKNDK